ncbi:hypothetical protein EIN_378360 [Entamoeba invadens IP1]|uniref:Uncharacterized protein n=1 Tax=Entamoeba invadens IP1 TaxID=370355 RepID=A0A0A1TYF8_ENTIV|nr:hypothetical protein EIN_378360 [Entamoeba invadens IP1]ELP83531.1 hypothetical protein EIN_378360 [Entamoeba invadens IP1]|eukprot:XP_004182877.1 hypothetical protein EIN_378360 [Entamoeba invadens IP1]
MIKDPRKLHEELQLQQLDQLESHINVNERLLHQMLWFGDYSYYSHRLIYHKDTLKIETPTFAENEQGYACAILSVPLQSFSVRIIQGKVNIGFVTYTKDFPLDNNLTQQADAIRVVFADGTFVGPEYEINRPKADFDLTSGVRTVSLNSEDYTISVSDQTTSIVGFKNVNTIGLFPIIALKSGTVIQVL